MPMTGNLTIFALPEVLQMLESAERSGELSIWTPDGIHRIWLDRGRITAAISPKAENKLKNILLDLGSIDVEQFNQLNLLQSLNEPLGKYLEMKSWISAINLVELFRRQMQIGLYSLLQLTSGQFYFIARQRPPYEEMTGLSKKATDAVLEGLSSLKNPDRTELPKLDSYFIRISDRYSTINLSMTELTLLNWLKTAKVLGDFCQHMKIEPLEVQMSCQRLQQLGLIEESTDFAKVEMKVPKETEPVKSQKISRELLSRFSSILNKNKS